MSSTADLTHHVLTIASNNSRSYASSTIKGAIFKGGSPFFLNCENINETYGIYLQIRCVRTSDDYEIFRIGDFSDEIGFLVPTTYALPLLVSQYVDCTWIIDVSVNS